MSIAVDFSSVFSSLKFTSSPPCRVSLWLGSPILSNSNGFSVIASPYSPAKNWTTIGSFDISFQLNPKNLDLKNLLHCSLIHQFLTLLLLVIHTELLHLAYQVHFHWEKLR